MSQRDRVPDPRAMKSTMASIMSSGNIERPSTSLTNQYPPQSIRVAATLEVMPYAAFITIH
ncbi:hypothetical protein BAUCODRAFT_374074 [Baudoinia panamericana UAMH 10762]|uniref:Uncharacterized protein n=1 Tax=Baudoinia panamericana (strain UAMH 10762) TaxID=717646 RepID=M2NMD8_BAUPA|nr:uncharacterized protein BAUCODRAFT_374074 [Baudoinia panamericana UAMH 10762]EMD00346.1 hypothetical protein BAUCODRAFT_374074 [Baudoinia panamericana UAMH 10762]